MNNKLKRIIIFFTLCIVLTGIVFFIKNYHDNSIENTYINYVENTLIPKYGKSSLYLENGNDLTIEGKKLLNKDAEGILFYKTLNLNKDTNKNLLVLRTNKKYNLEYEGSIGVELIYDIYTIDNKKIKQIKICENKFYLLGDFLNDPQKNTVEYSIFTTKNEPQNHFCTNYTSLYFPKNSFFFRLKIFKLDENNSSINLEYELPVEVNTLNNSEHNFKIIQSKKDYDLIFKNKIDLKNKCISDTQKYGLSNLIKNIFHYTENKSFTDISKLNNINKIISIKIK